MLYIPPSYLILVVFMVGFTRMIIATLDITTFFSGMWLRNLYYLNVL
jgi:hypothetical protein